MDIFNRGQIRLVMFGLEIDDLASDHTVNGAGAARDLLDQTDASFGWALQPRQDFVSPSLQSVACENSDSFPIYFVTSRAAAPQIIVVESGKIVVDQRVSVQHFHCGPEVFDSTRQ